MCHFKFINFPVFVGEKPLKNSPSPWALEFIDCWSFAGENALKSTPYSHHIPHFQSYFHPSFIILKMVCFSMMGIWGIWYFSMIFTIFSNINGFSSFWTFSMIFPSFFPRFFLCFTASLFGASPTRNSPCGPAFVKKPSDDANFQGLSEALPNGFLQLEPENCCVR